MLFPNGTNASHGVGIMLIDGFEVTIEKLDNDIMVSVHGHSTRMRMDRGHWHAYSYGSHGCKEQPCCSLHAKVLSRAHWLVRSGNIVKSPEGDWEQTPCPSCGALSEHRSSDNGYYGFRTFCGECGRMGEDY